MTHALASETTVVAASEPVSTTVDGEEVILHPGTGQYHGLNAVGTKIWERVREPTTVESLTRDIAEAHGEPHERVRGDVESFHVDLLDADLVRVDDAAR